MAKIKVGVEQIEDHIACYSSIDVTSFTWDRHNRPEIEWELSSKLGPLVYDDDQYIDVIDYNILLTIHKELQQEYDQLLEQNKQLQTQLKTKPFWKFW